MPFADIPYVVHLVGRITPNGVSLLGSAFLTSKPGTFVTAAHVAGNDDSNLVVVLSKIRSFSQYQDTSDNSLQAIPARIGAIDPFRDLCVLTTDTDVKANVSIQGTDAVGVGDGVAIFGYPHANFGRMVLTHHSTAVGAKILIDSSGLKSKHFVLNTQARTGQSGSPVFSLKDLSLVAILIGSYAPGGGGGISLGGVDPHTLHQTTYAVSAEYLKDML